nr:hypothetical protein CFP56_00359 [Quercus suber]
MTADRWGQSVGATVRYLERADRGQMSRAKREAVFLLLLGGATVVGKELGRQRRTFTHGISHDAKATLLGLRGGQPPPVLAPESLAPSVARLGPENTRSRPRKLEISSCTGTSNRGLPDPSPCRCLTLLHDHIPPLGESYSRGRSLIWMKNLVLIYGAMNWTNLTTTYSARV